MEPKRSRPRWRCLFAGPFVGSGPGRLGANATTYQLATTAYLFQNAGYRVRAERTDPRTGAAIVSDFAQVVAIGEAAQYDAR